MVWFALTFVALTAFAGLAIEYNRWQQIATRAQKAADAAALAGAVFMPENVGNKAFTTAKTLASENGFTNGSNGVTVTTAAGQLPEPAQGHGLDQHQEPVGRARRTTTARRSCAARWPSTSCRRTSGARRTRYGNDPESAAAQPQFWGNVFGPSSNKDKGDAIQSVGPTANATLCNADNCVRPPTPSRRTRTTTPTGYFYGIDVPAGTTGALNVQVFDPAFVHVGDNCGAATRTRTNSLEQRGHAHRGADPGLHRARSRRRCATHRRARSAFCTGDNYYGDGSNTANPWTDVDAARARRLDVGPDQQPDRVPGRVPGRLPGDDATTCPTAPSTPTHLKTLLQQSTNYPGTNPARTFASFFRQWVTICSVASPVQGTYFLQVQTGEEDRRHGGAERRWLEPVRDPGRAWAATSRRPTACTCTATRRWASTRTRPAPNTQFYLTRVLPGEAGKTLMLNFFDTGDASQPGTLAVLPPARLERGRRRVRELPVHANHRGTRPGHRGARFSATATGCKITGVSNTGTPNYNGQWVTWEIPIPRTTRATPPTRSVLDQAAVHLPGGHQRLRHDDLDRVHPRGARPPDPVARRGPMGPVPWCDDVRPVPLAVDREGRRHLPVVRAGRSTPATPTDGRGRVRRRRGRSPPIPWHLWLLAGALAVYLGYRAMQGIEWLLN